MNDYLQENPISCINCLNQLVLADQDRHYCCVLNQYIPVGEDLGSQTNCKHWELKPEFFRSSPLAGDGGRKANSSGKSVEHIIGCLLEERGYKVYYRYKLPIVGILGNDVIVDIFCQGIPQFPNGLIIESKWQNSSGSAYQKIFYAVENIKRVYPCATILILDGDYMKQSDICINLFEYMKKQIDSTLIGVYRLDKFVSWVVGNLPIKTSC